MTGITKRGTYTKRDYELVAKILHKAARFEPDPSIFADPAHGGERVRLTIAKLFADEFEADNKSFDRSRFLKACNNAR